MIFTFAFAQNILNIGLLFLRTKAHSADTWRWQDKREKVNFTLEQVMKTPKGSRNTAPLFI
jgi:hypothetical protein